MVSPDQLADTIGKAIGKAMKEQPVGLAVLPGKGGITATFWQREPEVSQKVMAANFLSGLINQFVTAGTLTAEEVRGIAVQHTEKWIVKVPIDAEGKPN